MGELEFAMVVLSALLHATWSASIKSSVEPLAFNLSQASVTALIGLCVLPWAGLSAFPERLWWLLAATSVAHGAYYYWLSRSLAETELSLAYPIIRSTPAFLPWIAVPLLGEDLSVWGMVGIAVVVLGIWTVRGTARGTNPGRLSLAYLTLLTTVAYSLFDKQLMAGLSELPWEGSIPRALTLYLLINAGGTTVFAPIALVHLGKSSNLGSVWTALRGETRNVLGAVVISMLGYGLILQAYQTAPASYVVAVRQLSVLFALLIAAAFLGERPTWRRSLGAAATVAGVALIALRG